MMSRFSWSVVTPRSAFTMLVVSKEVSAPAFRVLMVRLAADVVLSTAPASQTTVPTSPLFSMLNLRTCPSQKDSALMGWKEAS